MPAPDTAASATPKRPLRWLVERLLPSENTLLIALAIGVGIVSGLGSVGFHLLIEGTHLAAFDWAALPAGWPRALLAPALGALLAGTLIWLLARHDHGHGTSSVMEAVALRGGRLGARPILTKVVAAGVLIGAGGSAGPEDPSVQIGSVVGSVTGQRLRLSDERVRTLVAAGVASAIAAAFNAPIAGVFFALEIVAAEFSTALFAPVVLAAVAAAIVSRALLGAEPAFQVPAYELVNPLLETPLYAVLGLVAAVVGVLFMQAVFLSEAAFERARLSKPLRALAGGLLVGLLGLAAPGALGVSYEAAGAILNGRGALGLALLGFLAVKFLATAITLGAAEVGGTFAPSLVLGAALGGLFGQAANAWLPGAIAPPAAYALVGMGAVLTAVVRAPISAVLLLFEVTGDYRIILPIMASVVVSTLFAHRLHPESIYGERLARQGIQLRFGRDVNILEVVTVVEAMTPDFTTVRPDMTIAELEALFDQTRHHGFPVLDRAGGLRGMVTLSDLERAAEAGLPPETPVERIATSELVVAHPDESLNAALRAFAQADVGRLPVVERANPRRLVGVLRRGDIAKAYQLGALRRAELEHRWQQMRVSSHSGAQLAEQIVAPGSAGVGRPIRDLGLPREAIITTIRRGGSAIIPRGDTILRAGDRLTVLGKPEQLELVRQRLAQPAAGDTTPRYLQLVAPAGAPSVGRTVAELKLPPGALIVALRRGEQVQTVHGATVLAAGDELTILASPDATPAVRRIVLGDRAETSNADSV